MRNQQEVEKAEQRRIKNLVLNYDLTDDQADGDPPAFHYVSSSKNNVRLVGKGSLNRSLNARNNERGPTQRSTTHSDEENITPPPDSDNNCGNHQPDSLTDEIGLYDSLHSTTGPRFDKSGNSRQKQRARKLQLGDIDWYGKQPAPSSTPTQRKEGEHSLDQFVVDKKSNRGRGLNSRRGSGTKIKG